jgi:hypothetical protein
MPEVQNANLCKIIKRLELIKSLISLEEEDEIDANVLKLQQLGITPEYFCHWCGQFNSTRNITAAKPWIYSYKKTCEVAYSK